MKAYSTINMTKWHCSRIYIKLVITTKPVFAFLTPLKWALSLAACKQRSEPFTPMMWFDFIKWRFHFIRVRCPYSMRIKYCRKGMIQNRISSETHNWYVFATWEIGPKNLGFTQRTSQGGVEGKIILLILAPMSFLWNNLGSVCRYIMGQFNGYSSQYGKGQQHLAAPIWKCMSGIGDHRFIFLMDLLSNYTFYTNQATFPLGDCL